MGSGRASAYRVRPRANRASAVPIFLGSEARRQLEIPAPETADETGGPNSGRLRQGGTLLHRVSHSDGNCEPLHSLLRRPQHDYVPQLGSAAFPTFIGIIFYRLARVRARVSAAGGLHRKKLSLSCGGSRQSSLQLFGAKRGFACLIAHTAEPPISYPGLIYFAIAVLGHAEHKVLIMRTYRSRTGMPTCRER